ncbi:hypothetical protein, partial [Xanthomonas hortorum]|uniref:hypothetical protein n=1 Tax=Xanthomonas hortorum TaxID=56454 RepID=UPI001F401347
MLALLHSLDKLRDLAQDGGASRSTATTNGFESLQKLGVDEAGKSAMMGDSLHGKTLRRIEVQRRQLPLHEGLTKMKSLLIWSARFAENLRV